MILAKTIDDLRTGVLDGTLLEACNSMPMSVHTIDWKQCLYGASGETKLFRTGPTGGDPVALVANKLFLFGEGERTAHVVTVGCAAHRNHDIENQALPERTCVDDADYWQDAYDLSERPLVVDCMGEFCVQISFLHDCIVSAYFLVDVYVAGDIRHRRRYRCGWRLVRK